LRRLKDEPSSRIKKLEKDLLQRKEEIDDIKQKFETLNKKRIEKEKDLEMEVEKVKKSEKRLMEIKTNKEYEALLKEIAFAKELNRDIEEEIIEIMDEIEEANKEIAVKESGFNIQKKNLEKEKIEFKSKSIQFEEELKKNISKRENIVNGIKPDLIKQYNIIREKRQGIAVVCAENEICQGCHLNILPQLYNELQRCESLILCPNCLRILYWKNTQKPD
jgi:hypothetical protein